MDPKGFPGALAFCISAPCFAGNPGVKREGTRDCSLRANCYNVIVTRKDLHNQALALPPDERARLAHDIIASLDGPADEGAAEAWVREIERRVREVRGGSVKLIDWKDTRARILKRLASGD